MNKIYPTICLTLLLSSCASTMQYVKYPDDESINENKSKIYVIRSTIFGSAIKMKIYQDDQLIGKLGPKSFLSWEVDPSKGDMAIISKSENKDTLKISPKPGKTYYIKQKVKLGWVVARTGLEFLEENEAKKILSELKNPRIK